VISTRDVLVTSDAITTHPTHMIHTFIPHYYTLTGARLNWQPSYVAKKRDASGQLTSGTSRGSIESKEDGDYSEASVKAGCKCAIM